MEHGRCVLQAIHYWILNCEKSCGTRGGDEGGVGGVGGVERVLRGRLMVRRGPRVRAGTVSSVWTSHSVAHAIAPVQRLPRRGADRARCRYAAHRARGAACLGLCHLLRSSVVGVNDVEER
jgi:hypothetical protein